MCCRSHEHSHHDHKGGCCGLCGGVPEDPEKKSIVAPERKGGCCGINYDKSYLARGMGRRPVYEGEVWNHWGRVGKNGSFFNRQREKSGFPRLLGGRKQYKGWPEDEQKTHEENGIEPASERKSSRRDEEDD